MVVIVWARTGTQVISKKQRLKTPKVVTTFMITPTVETPRSHLNVPPQINRIDSKMEQSPYSHG